MSANNWTVCPRCARVWQDKKEAAHKKAAEVYGKVPPHKWMELTRKAEAVEGPEETMREDWEIGTRGSSTFQVGYSCACEKCGFRFSFKHSQEMPL